MLSVGVQLRWPLINTRRAASERDLTRLGVGALNRRSLMGSFMLWTCLILTLMVAISLLFPFKGYAQQPIGLQR